MRQFTRQHLNLWSAQRQYGRSKLTHKNLVTHAVCTCDSPQAHSSLICGQPVQCTCSKSDLKASLRTHCEHLRQPASIYAHICGQPVDLLEIWPESILRTRCQCLFNLHACRILVVWLCTREKKFLPSAASSQVPEVYLNQMMRTRGQSVHRSTTAA